MNAMLALVVVAGAALPASHALAQPKPIRGMFLCASPVIANNLWQDVIDIGGKGIPITFPMLETLATRKQCPFVESEKLKPTKFVAGQFQITNGRADGWAHPDYYIRYVND